MACTNLSSILFLSFNFVIFFSLVNFAIFVNVALVGATSSSSLHCLHSLRCRHSSSISITNANANTNIYTNTNVNFSLPECSGYDTIQRSNNVIDANHIRGANDSNGADNFNVADAASDADACRSIPSCHLHHFTHCTHRTHHTNWVHRIHRTLVPHVRQLDRRYCPLPSPPCRQSCPRPRREAHCAFVSLLWQRQDRHQLRHQIRHLQLHQQQHRQWYHQLHPQLRRWRTWYSLNAESTSSLEDNQQPQPQKTQKQQMKPQMKPQTKQQTKQQTKGPIQESEQKIQTTQTKDLIEPMETKKRKARKKNPQKEKMIQTLNAIEHVDLRNKTKIRFRARVSYCGTPYHGWQLQPIRQTVQGEIEHVLSLRFLRRIPVVGAGRTDAGVHARGQAIHFDLMEEEVSFGIPKLPVMPEVERFGLDESDESDGLEGLEGNATTSSKVTPSTTSTVMASFPNEEDENQCLQFCQTLQHSMNRMLPVDIRVFQLEVAPYTFSLSGKGSKGVADGIQDGGEDEDDGVEFEDEDDYEDYEDGEDGIDSKSVYDHPNKVNGTMQNRPPQNRTSTNPKNHNPPRPRPWHAIQSATGKWYSYKFTLGPTLWNPMERFTRTHFVHRPFYSPPDSTPSPSPSSTASTASIPSPTRSNTYHALTKHDIQRLQSILQLYQGTHDFRAFGGQLEQTQKRAGRRMNTVRTVYKVELVKEPLMETFGSIGLIGSIGSDSSDTSDDSNNSNSSNDLDFHESTVSESLGFIGEEGNYRVDFLLQGALYKMVRNMVGTAMEVWLGRMEEERLVELLKVREDGEEDEECDERGNEDGLEKKKTQFGRRDNPCKPAPPEVSLCVCICG